MLHTEFVRPMSLLVAVLVTSLSVCSVARGVEKTHELGVRGSQFTLDGRPVFLLGCSYYGALGGDEKTWRADLDDMHKAGINWIRVWATWSAFGRNVSAVDGKTGEPRGELMEKLKRLVAECDRRGMVVDVSLSRGNGVAGPGGLKSIDAHLRAVESLDGSLKPRRNWYLDLSNERNIQDERFTSFDDLARLRARVREIDPKRLVTASQGGDISEDELRKYVVKAGVDFITPHRPRDAESPRQTEKMTRQYLAMMKKLDRVVPVHYQEPFRRGYGDEPDVKDFETDLRGAIAGGAAGWCFHNGSNRQTKEGHPRRSFDIGSKRLFDQLDEVERAAVGRFKGIVPEAR